MRMGNISVVVLVALFVTLIPTTIGALLSAIGIAGMDRLVKFNVLAMSGRAVEAAGDVDTLLLDKTGTITLGNRQACELAPLPGINVKDLAEAAQLASLSDETPEGRSILTLVREKYNVAAIDKPPEGAQFVPFSAHTRMSGVDFDGIAIRKGAVDSVAKYVRELAGAPNTRMPAGAGSHYQQNRARRAARRWPSRGRTACWALFILRTSSKAAFAKGSRNYVVWVSIRS